MLDGKESTKNVINREFLRGITPQNVREGVDSNASHEFLGGYVVQGCGGRHARLVKSASAQRALCIELGAHLTLAKNTSRRPSSSNAC